MKEVDYSDIKTKNLCEFKFRKDGVEQDVHINRRELRFNKNETLTRVERYGNSVSRDIEGWYYECDPHSHKMYIYNGNPHGLNVKTVGHLYKVDGDIFVLDLYNYDGDVYETILYKKE